MNTISGSKAVSIRTVLAVAAMLGLSAPVTAQEPTQELDLMSCSSLQAGAQAELMFACAGHPGCGLVIKQLKTCDKAQEFIARLDRGLAGRKKVTGYDVFEAAAPPVTGDPEFTKASHAIRSAYLKQKGIVTKSDTTQKGTGWFYEGPMVGDKRHGTGIFINTRGFMYLTGFIDDRAIGKGERVGLMSGKRYVGGIKSLRYEGQGIYRSERGDRYAGSFVAGKRHGHGTYTWTSGSRYEGEYRNHKKFNGVVKNASGKIVAEFKDGVQRKKDVGESANETLEALK